MPKVIVFFDGTWTVSTNRSNVWLLSQALKADELNYKMSETKKPYSITFDTDEQTMLAQPASDTIKLYLPGVGNSDDYNKLCQYLFAVTGDGTLNIAQHAVDCIEATRLKLGLEPKDIMISTVGFSRGAASATFFMQFMHAKGYVPDAIIFFDRVFSPHLLNRARMRNYDMSLPKANATLHLVAAHDKRQFPDQYKLPRQLDLISYFDPELIWQDTEYRRRMIEIFMAGLHSDVGGNKLNRPQADDTLRIAAYVMLNLGNEFDLNFLTDLMNKEAHCDPVQKNEEFSEDNVFGRVLNKALFHDRVPVVFDKDGKIEKRRLITVHERVFIRLQDQQKFQNQDLPYEIPFLNDTTMLRVFNDDGDTCIYQRKDGEWTLVPNSKRIAENVFNFEQARSRIEAEIKELANQPQTLMATKPVQKIPKIYPWETIQPEPTLTTWMDTLNLRASGENPSPFTHQPELEVEQEEQQQQQEGEDNDALTVEALVRRRFIKK